MVTDNPLIESCFSRTPLTRNFGNLAGDWSGSAWLGWKLTGAGWVLAGCWLGAGWELAGEARVPKTSFDFLRGAIREVARGGYSGWS